MNWKFIFKFLLIFFALIAIQVAYMNYPAILASFDENKYVNEEVFTPVDGQYDFRLFTLNSSTTKNYTAFVEKSGFAQFVDDKGNHTINVMQWNKMSYTQKDRLYSSFLLELDRSYHETDGIRIIEIDYLGVPFYGAYINRTDTLIYIATPTEEETLEMIESLEFKEEALS